MIDLIDPRHGEHPDKPVVYRLKIGKKYLKNVTPNRSDRRGAPIKFIVVHYTGSAGQSIDEAAKYMQKPEAAVSAHFLVQDGRIEQIVPTGDAAWHVGDGRPNKKYERGEDALRWRFQQNGECEGNRSCIGVELCVEKTKKTKKVRDTDWFFTPETIETAQKLIGYLMQEFNIPGHRVARHMDVTGKPCPRPFVSLKSDGNDQFDQDWEIFRKNCIAYANSCAMIGEVTK